MTAIPACSIPARSTLRCTGVQPAPHASAHRRGDPPAAAQADDRGAHHPAGAAVDPGRRIRARRPADPATVRRGSSTSPPTGGLNFAAFSFFASVGYLLVVAVALFCGDTVASEAGWGTLRYLLAAPVPRARLLRQKLVVALAYSAVAVTSFPLMSLAAGTVAFGWHPLRLPGTGVECSAPAWRWAGWASCWSMCSAPNSSSPGSPSCSRCPPTRRWARWAVRWAWSSSATSWTR